MNECDFCGAEITGEPVYDEAQLFWLGRAKAAKFCSEDCEQNAAEAQSERRIAAFYGGDAA